MGKHQNHSLLPRRPRRPYAKLRFAAQLIEVYLAEAERRSVNAPLYRRTAASLAEYAERVVLHHVAEHGL